ncbi:MAG: lysoplasmalogenase family protein [Erysipelotrichaceae bacterium]|nr:lysoplasmalogenase family protein [Erysipelotrichaceae bacterium]
MTIILFFSLFLFIGLILTCYHPRFRSYHLVMKTLCSLGFLLLAFYQNWQVPVSYFWQLWFGLVLCFVGDVLLGIFFHRKEKSYFLAGLVVFLIAHVVFVYTLHLKLELQIAEVIFACGFVILSLCLSKLPKMKMKKMLWPILFYSFFVSLFMIKGIGLGIHATDMKHLLIMMAAILFFTSDFILLWMRFYEDKWKYSQFCNLLTYYSAMYLLAFSIAL